ncbi:snRNA transcription by RNA polymerase III [Desmophyllum pertusum]|uniref:snRNA transcription by RNA polymerase III n=1 Tax=Desmophyllum pertusum TaxID=174260 RepID=A0A9W9ZH58_9CNID|nr:snRNA transcription by RNA polymerase III [Desmophyllum pertusum]
MAALDDERAQRTVVERDSQCYIYMFSERNVYINGVGPGSSARLVRCVRSALCITARCNLTMKELKLFRQISSSLAPYEAAEISRRSQNGRFERALEALKKEHTLTLRMVKEKIISTDELIKKYQQKCHESDKHLQQVTDCTLKLEAAQMKTDALQSQLDRSLHSSEPLRKNVARLHREKSLADSAISELREKLQSCEKMNSEMLSTSRIKEEQECAWRLEKQVQAHEMQKQKKSFEKSEAAIVKLQQQLKKDKEQKKELTRSLSQANRKTAKIEQQLQKSKEEIQSIKLEAEFARVLEKDLIGGTPKPRQRQKSRQPPQLPKACEQTSSSGPHPNQQLAHVIEELTVLSDMGPALSPLPPSPDRGALEHSSGSEEESVSESSSEDDGNTSEDGDSDHSLGDLADMLIGDHSEAEQLVASPGETGVNAQEIDRGY